MFTDEVGLVIVCNAGEMTSHKNTGGLSNALTAILKSTMNTRPEAPADFPALPAMQKRVEILCTWHSDGLLWQA